MNETNRLVILITGASAGIGDAVVSQLLAQGHRVWASARDTKKLSHLIEAGAKPLTLDVEIESSMKRAVSKLVKAEGRIDVLINNAGYGSYGSLEEVPLSEGRHQFEVNLFGLARLTQLVLPIMRDQGSGRIVNLASIASHIAVPVGSWYHASKHALVGLSDSLRLELKPLGIKVVTVKPGLVNTNWNRIAIESLDKYSGRGPYQDSAKAVTEYFKQGGVDVKKVAKTVVKAATTKAPASSYVTPWGAKIILLGRRFLPERLFFFITSRVLMRQNAKVKA